MTEQKKETAQTSALNARTPEEAVLLLYFRQLTEIHQRCEIARLEGMLTVLEATNAA